MPSKIWLRLKAEIASWRAGAIPGTAVLGVIILARLTGLLQSIEWSAFDSFLRLRPVETIDKRVVIIGINQTDISNVKAYPIPDREIAALINKLQTYKPRVIGLDLIKDVPVSPGHEELLAAFKQSKNLIAIEKVLPVKIPPPPNLPPEQIGFSDAILDADGRLRRSLLGVPTASGYKYSLGLRLAKAYLAAEKIPLTNSKRDRHAMQFGDTEIPRFSPNFGGYVGTNAGGVQTLINFRSGKNRFPVLSLSQIKTGRFDPEIIRDRIVIIGMTAPGIDIVNTSATVGIDSVPGQVYGVEIKAHATSQILSAVLDRRPLFKVWAEGWEYLWIIIWGLLGIALSRITQSPSKNLFGVCLSSVVLVGASYLLLIWGWWVPVIPPLLVLLVNGIGFTANAFYQCDRALKARIQERQSIIERTFTTIHNGPLQILAATLRQAKEQNGSQNELVLELEKLNCELRAIYEFLQQEPLSQENSLYLSNNLKLNLQVPLHEILYQVYDRTLELNLPCFKTLRVKISTFDPVEDKRLTLEQKQSICRFLEEALCNVGKHATGVTRLGVTLTQKEGWCILQIKDNGAGISSSATGRGTQQFKHIARQLRGKFQRSPLTPCGTLCELTWRAVKF